MSEQTLTSLAVLTVNWDEGRDFIDSFVPIIAYCVGRDGSRPVSQVELQQAVAEEAGIKIPLGALQAIISRCAREGLLKRREGVSVPNEEKLSELDYASTRADALRQHRALLEKLREFARGRDVNWSQEEAQDHLLAYLKQGSVPVLAAATEGDPLPGPARINRKAKYVIGAFIAELSDSDPEGFASLVVVAKGFVLSGVLYYPDLGQVEARLDNLEVYCDTPFILKALNYSEEGMHQQAVELIELLRDLGAKLKCFHHTREEVAGVLEAELGSIRSGSAGDSAYGSPMSRRFRREDVEEILVNIDGALRELGIEVVDKPDFTAVPDEAALDDALAEVIDYNRARTREKDVESLAGVDRLRKHRHIDNFENAPAIFVTTNTSLARASSRFFRDIERPGSIPTCVSVETLTRLAWVKKPMSAPDLPKHMMIASSYAALNPSPALWRKYLDALTRRKEKGELSDEDYHLLRSSIEARRALMDKTLGDEEAFSAGSIDEVLEHAKATIRAEAEHETEEERRKRIAAEQSAKGHRTRAERIDRAHRSRVNRRAHRWGEALSWSLAGAIAVIVVLGLLATFGLWIDVNGVVHLLVVLGVGAVFLLTLGSFFTNRVNVGTARRAISDKVEATVSRRGHADLDELHGSAEERE